MSNSRYKPVTEDERLLLDVVDALRGADSLRERLTTRLQTGTPAVSDLAYAVTTRVKEDYKIVEKVKVKRAGRLDYDVKDVTDLVGLRIITLYRMDIMTVIDALLDTIARDVSDDAVFVNGSIAEALIYSTNPTGDAQELPKKVKALFESRGIAAEIVERPSAICSRNTASNTSEIEGLDHMTTDRSPPCKAAQDLDRSPRHLKVRRSCPTEDASAWARRAAR